MITGQVSEHRCGCARSEDLKGKKSLCRHLGCADSRFQIYHTSAANTKWLKTRGKKGVIFLPRSESSGTDELVQVGSDDSKLDAVVDDPGLGRR